MGLKKQTAKPPARADTSCTHCSPRTRRRTGSTGLSAALAPKVSSERLFPFHRWVGLRVVQGCPGVVGAAGVLGPGTRRAGAPQRLFDSSQSCPNVIHRQEQQGMGSSSLLTFASPHLYHEGTGAHRTPGSPGVTAQPPTGKNKCAPTTIESERTDRIIKAGIGVILFPFLWEIQCKRNCS